MIDGAVELLLAVALIALVSRQLVVLLARFAVWLTRRRDPLATQRTGPEGMLQERGVVRAALAPRGQIFVRGELWTAVAEEPIAAGEEVEVEAVDGLTLTVRRWPPPQ